MKDVMSTVKEIGALDCCFFFIQFVVFRTDEYDWKELYFDRQDSAWRSRGEYYC